MPASHWLHLMSSMICTGTCSRRMGGRCQGCDCSYCLPPSSSLHFIYVSCYRTTIEFLLSRSKVITYKGQDLILAILSNFTGILPKGHVSLVMCRNLNFSYFRSVWKDWCPLDTAVGAWLLDPDHTPSSFSELLVRYGMQQMTPPTTEGDLSALHHQDLGLLGPLMVKIYRQLQVRAREHAS